MVFDSWGGTLSTHAYRESRLRYLAQIVAGLKKEHDGARIPQHRLHRGW
jgi:uroporphyrinogen decarboxylase